MNYYLFGLILCISGSLFGMNNSKGASEVILKRFLDLVENEKLPEIEAYLKDTYFSGSQLTEALHHAIQGGRSATPVLNCVALLLHHGAPVNGFRNGITALHWAIYKENPTIIRWLRIFRIDNSIVSDCKNHSRLLCKRDDPQREARRREILQILESSQYKFPVEQKNEIRTTSLNADQAVLHSNLPALMHFLEESKYKKESNTNNIALDMLLLLASAKRNYQVIPVLLKKGANPETNFTTLVLGNDEVMISEYIKRGYITPQMHKRYRGFITKKTEQLLTHPSIVMLESRQEKNVALALRNRQHGIKRVTPHKSN